LEGRSLIARIKPAFLLGIVAVFGFLTLFGCTSGGTNEGAHGNSSHRNGKGEIILATTTSTYDTGLLDVLIPDFEKKTGYTVKPIAVGTGKALAMGSRGDADLLLVHAPEAEMELVHSGAAVNRHGVMYNYFAIVGPPSDPAGIAGMEDPVAAFAGIAEREALFVSRGDDSGTHKKELKIWQKAGVTPGGPWYLETGTGMGDTLKVASEKSGYTLTDWGTFLALKRNLSLIPLVTGSDMLLNVYHVMQVNPAKFEDVNAEGAEAFINYIISEDAQRLIGEFKREEYGVSLFIPSAKK